jgi:DNA-binding GntR family transcriptional regulator
VKYAQIVAALRRQIADGTYPPGSLLPSETKLIEEFGVSRPTVVRALEELKLRGEIDREHGRGSFVKAAPPLPENLAALVGSTDSTASRKDVLAEVTRRLAETTANLDAYIEERANEIADRRITEARQEFLEIRTDMEQEAASARQRSEDLVAELRRQLAIQVRRAERAEKLVKDLVKEATDD